MIPGRHPEGSLYHDRELASRLGANARRAALEFDRPVQVRAYYELFRELCEPLTPHSLLCTESVRQNR